jgi:hypothetical protein
MSHLELYRSLCKGDSRHNRRMKGFLQPKAIDLKSIPGLIRLFIATQDKAIG